MPVSDSPMVSRASSMEHIHTFGKPVGFKKSPFAFSGTGFAFGGARSEYLRKSSTTSLTNGDLSAQKVSASGEITRAENGFLDKANHLRSILAENEKSKAEEELSKRKETTKTEITMRNEMDQRELLDAKARSSEILTTQHSLMAKLVEDVKQNLKEAYSKEIREEVLAQYQRSTRTLKEEAKSEFIKQIAPDVKAELRLELRQEAKEEAVVELNEELRSEFIKLKAHLKGEVTSTLRAELSSEVRTELKAIYTDSIKDELRGLYSDQIKDELRQKLMLEVYAEAETDRKLKELAQREKELEAELEGVNERNPSVERDEFTGGVHQRNPSVERDKFTESVNQRNGSVEHDEFTEDVNEHHPSAERDEFTDAASQVHTGEPVRNHVLDRSQFSMSPEHSVPESETLRADLPPVTNESLYPTLTRGHDGSLFNWNEEPLSPVINGHALSPIARQAKISTQSPSPAHSTKRSHDHLADGDMGEKHLGGNSKSARHDLTLDHNGQAHDALNDEHFYGKGAVDDPETNHGREAMSPSGEFGAEGVSHKDGPGDQWAVKAEISSEDYLAIEGDGATGMKEENVYPLDAKGAPIYYEDNEEGFGDVDGKKSFVANDEMLSAHIDGTGSEPGDRVCITNENKQGTNSPSSSPLPRAAKRALDADDYWGSHPKRARDNSRQSSLFLTDDEQESRFKHIPNKHVEREATVLNEVAAAEEVSRSPWRYERREEYDDEEVEYSEREEYTSGSDDEDEDEDMDMGRSMPGLDASPDSRAGWYHGGPVSYPPLDNRGSSLDDAIKLDSDSEDEEVSVIQETFQPSIEGSPELTVQDSLEFRGANTLEQDAQLKSSIDEDDLLEYDSDEAERP